MTQGEMRLITICEQLNRKITEVQAELADVKAALKVTDKAWVGVAEAARLLGISKAAVNQRANRGTLPYMVDDKGHRRFSVKHLKA